MSGRRIELDSQGTTTSQFLSGTDKVSAGVTKKCADTYVVDSFSHAHFNVHRGNFWSVYKTFDSVGNSAVAEVLFVPGEHSHLNFEFSGGGSFKYFLIEGVTVSGNGTTLTAYGNNRPGETTTAGVWFHTPAGVTGGSQIIEGFIPGGTTGQAVGGTGGGPIREGTEWILSSGTKYLFRLLNQSGAADTFQSAFSYYEEGF